MGNHRQPCQLILTVDKKSYLWATDEFSAFSDADMKSELREL